MKIIAGLLMSPILVTHSSAYNPKNDPNLYKGWY